MTGTPGGPVWRGKGFAIVAMIYDETKKKTIYVTCTYVQWPHCRCPAEMFLSVLSSPLFISIIDLKGTSYSTAPSPNIPSPVLSCQVDIN